MIKVRLGNDLKFTIEVKMCCNIVDISEIEDVIVTVRHAFNGKTIPVENVEVKDTGIEVEILNNHIANTGPYNANISFNYPDDSYSSGFRKVEISKRAFEIVGVCQDVDPCNNNTLTASMSPIYKGKDGKDGEDGEDGKSSYQIWLDLNNTGSEQDFIDAEFRAQERDAAIESANEAADNANAAAANAAPTGQVAEGESKAVSGGEVFNYLKNIDQILLNHYAYGIEIAIEEANSAVKRIGNLELHRSMPLQNKMRGCLLLDNGQVNYYLDKNTDLLKEDGTPSILDGTDGQVMVEIPETYYKGIFTATTAKIYFSDSPLPGFSKWDKKYISKYEAAVDRSTGTIKLASVINNAVAFRGGNNTAAWDGTYRSLLGMPATNITLTNFRTYARNRGVAGKDGAGWNCYTYDAHQHMYWLYVLEYANRNCQLAFNAALTVDGYKQGGLGAGVTNVDSAAWTEFNSQNPIIKCGYMADTGSNTAVKDYIMPSEYGTALTVSVPSYRGIENPFGHIWKWTDGVKFKIQAADAGGLSTMYKAPTPVLYQDANYTGYKSDGVMSRTSGFIKNIKNMDILPSEVGASSNTYYADQFYTTIPASGEEMRYLLLSGASGNGSSAGLVYTHSNAPVWNTAATIGSRLCFIP